MSEKEEKSDDMTPEERLAWLRERGVQIETSEERHEKLSQTNAIQEDEEEYEEISYVHIPHDESKPMKELSFRLPKSSLGKGDALSNHLKPYFGSSSSNGKNVDLSLLQEQATKQFGSSATSPVVSEEALKAVAAQGSVETFALVHPVPSNKFVGVNVYLDEVGALKRLPLNKRASDLSVGAGFNPPPSFYGDVFVGRVLNKPVLKNVSFQLGIDTSPDAKWLKSAMMENLEYQTEMNAITGKSDLQPSNAGEDGIAKDEGLYSWTQREEEVEIVLPIKSSSGVSSKDVKVTFRPKTLKVAHCGKEVLSLDFFARVDPDGCTWTLDKGGDEAKVVITCEKSDEVAWPRLTF